MMRFLNRSLFSTLCLPLLLSSWSLFIMPTLRCENAVPQWKSAVKKYFQAYSNENLVSYLALFNVGSYPSTGKIKALKGVWKHFENSSFALLKSSYVASGNRVVVSSPVIWFATHALTGDCFGLPMKKEFVFSKTAQGLKILSVTNRAVPEGRALDGILRKMFDRDKIGALKAIRSALDKFPQNPYVLYLFGYLMMIDDKPELATSVFKKVISLQPAHHLGRSFLSLLEKRDLFSLSSVASEAGVRVNDCASAYFTLLTGNQLKKGPVWRQYHIKLATMFCERFPESGIIHSMKGKIEQRLGDSVSARVSFEKSLSLYPTHFETILRLCGLSLREGRLQQAKKMIDLGQKEFRRNPAFITLKVRYYLKKGNRDTASRILASVRRKFPNYSPAIQLEKYLNKTGLNRAVRSGDVLFPEG